jgi:N-acetylmuramoyl-L-alanine amidase
MRKRFTLAALLLLFSAAGVAHPAEMKALPQKSLGLPASSVMDVAIRFSKHEGFSRIVFEAADEPFIQKTTVTSTPNQIRVQFPSDLSLRGQAGPELDASLKGKIYTMNVTSPFRVKALKLSSPPRLSIDIMPAEKEETRRPAAQPSTAAEWISHIRIVLDPGHGGYDSGILSGEFREKDITFSLARAMEAALLKKNKVVYLSRKADQFLSITERAVFASQKSPDVFISLHMSLSNDFVIYTSPGETGPDSESGLPSLMSRQRRFTEKSTVLAEMMGKALKEDFKKDVIFRKMALPLLNAVGAAAILVEVPGGVAGDQAMKTKISESLLKGVAFYAGQ